MAIQTNRHLLDYLPYFMQQYPEMREILNSDQIEVDGLWSALGLVFDNQYILSSTEYGVQRWERMMRITPKDTDSLDERKFRILARLNAELPYTLTKLREALRTLCGNDGFEIDLKPNIYHIEIKLGLGNRNNYDEVVELLRKMIPANMTQYVMVRYNTHNILSQYTHETLAQYTHEELRTTEFEVVCATYDEVRAYKHSTLGNFTHTKIREDEITNG